MSQEPEVVCVKNWEVIADNLSKAGWSWGCVSAIDSAGRTIWITDAHRDNGQRFIAHADDKLTAFCRARIGDSGIFQFHAPMLLPVAMNRFTIEMCAGFVDGIMAGSFAVRQSKTILGRS